MAGGKLNARQKMINLMYLVFIAMMALNIDREVLRSFDDINTQLIKSNTLATDNNNAFVASMKKTAQTDAKYAEAVQKSEAMKAKAEPLIQFIQNLKTQLVGTEARRDEEGELIYANLSNMESVTSLFFKSDKVETENGSKLVQMIKDFNNYLQSINKGTLSIDISDYKPKGKAAESWLFRKFYGQPQIAAETTLTELQTEVINAESEVIRSFLSQKVLENVEINDFKGIISSPGYVTRGTTQSTYAAIGAFDNRLQGSVTVNGRNYPLVDGRATIPLETGSVGVKNLSGSISFTDAKGVKQTRPLEQMTYEVVDAVISKNEFMGVITADKMNVLYVGLDNPVSATVSGVEPRTIQISGPGFRGSGPKGIVRPSSVGTINLVVSGTTSEGKRVSTTLPFRVKGLPSPEAQARGRAMLSLPASSLKGLKVDARMPQDFGFELSVNVTQFKVKVPGKQSETINGNSLAGASSVASAKPGSTVTIFDIKTSSSAPIPPAKNNIVIEVL